MSTNLSNDIANDSKSTAIFLLTYLFLSVKLWCKPYFNGLVSKSSLDRLITGTVYESFFLLLLLFEINLCTFLFLHWSYCKLLLFNVRRVFILILLYSKKPTCLNIAFDDNYEDVSYDLESLFTSPPVQEIIDYILYKIYFKKKLKPLCKKSIFKKLLNRLTIKCVFSANNRLMKKIDGCPMGGPLSVVLSDIYVCKMEEDIVTPSKPLFYKRYVDDTYVREKKEWNWWTLQCVELVPPKYKVDIRIGLGQVPWYRDYWK